MMTVKELRKALRGKPEDAIIVIQDHDQSVDEWSCLPRVVETSDALVAAIGRDCPNVAGRALVVLRG